MRTLLIAAALLLLAAAPAGAATVLEGTTGPGFTITLTQNGKAVKTLAPGTYEIRVSDRSTNHDFALRGPGVNTAITTVAGTGTRSKTVTLRRGTYTYLCSPHASMMRGSFRVR